MKYEFVPARRHGGSQSTHSLHRIVMHSTVTPCKDGWARKVAGWFHTWTKTASAHYVVDPSTVVKCLHDGTIGYHAPPNAGSIGVELCDYSKGDKWNGKSHVAMLRRAAKLVADKCHAYDIPIVWLTVDDLHAGKRGITSHLNISHTWHETTHTDPGGFPKNVFLQMVKDAMPGGGGGGKPPAAKHPYPGHLLKRGTKGAPVKQVQAELNDRAVTARHLAVDGIYGPATEKRVRGFQHNHHLAADGIVGPHTWKALFG